MCAGCTPGSPLSSASLHSSGRVLQGGKAVSLYRILPLALCALGHSFGPVTTSLCCFFSLCHRHEYFMNFLRGQEAFEQLLRVKTLAQITAGRSFPRFSPHLLGRVLRFCLASREGTRSLTRTQTSIMQADIHNVNRTYCIPHNGGISSKLCALLHTLLITCSHHEESLCNTHVGFIRVYRF